MTTVFTPLETERLHLRAFALEDAPIVRRLASDERIADTTLNVPHPYRDGDAEAWICLQIDHHRRGVGAHWALTRRGDGVLLGAMGLAINHAMSRAELGYWIGVPYWGQGYCAEAAATVLHYAFDILGLNRVHASHFGRNPASGRVLSRIGMIQEGVRRQHFGRSGRPEDMVMYGLVREQWLERRECREDMEWSV